jgi:hypothetical protein
MPKQLFGVEIPELITLALAKKIKAGIDADGFTCNIINNLYRSKTPDGFGNLEVSALGEQVHDTWQGFLHQHGIDTLGGGFSPDRQASLQSGKYSHPEARVWSDDVKALFGEPEYESDWMSSNANRHKFMDKLIEALS